MGETREDRCDLAFALKELGAHIVPMNFLNPIAGTPLGQQEPLAPLEILKSIACFRFILPRQEITVAGGRTVNLRDLQSLMFMAGASALMVGNYLTTPNQPVEKDLQMLKDLGLDPNWDKHGFSDQDEPGGCLRGCVQRLGKNIKGYGGETIDIDAVLRDCVAAAQARGWAIETINPAPKPILGFTRHASRITHHASPTRLSVPRIYISTGIHGDEPAGPLAARQLLQENAWPAGFDLWLCPCLNPTGFVLNRRENREGLDLNRQYRTPEAAETAAHIAWLRRQPSFDLCLCLHEDWEAHGFYLYELNPDHQPSLAEAMVARVGEVCPIDRSEVIEGRPAQNGIIRPSIDPRSRPDWPEAFFLITAQDAAVLYAGSSVGFSTGRARGGSGRGRDRCARGERPLARRFLHERGLTSAERTLTSAAPRAAPRSLFHPGVPQGGQRLVLQDALGQGKDDALFLVEMLARVGYGRQQQLPCLLEIFGLLHVLQAFVNLLVLLQETRRAGRVAQSNAPAAR